ncbi:hypothetical protein CC86DRAFT_369254 [Ophiobolus disseminans]|uniref:MYND-type zinc finger protein samB n=1 Tax=Ophiobolus disseminans TaxID=1469910 RepID=A0A6A7A614_9PLEO|nr:hypothetical protein CC86DRAFT_369254 [Ophiobolus disseminans]
MSQEDCAVCTRPAYTFCEYCANFDDTGVPVDARWYCTPLCQDIDRLSHNDKCTNMASDKELFGRAKQAGEAAQALFYAFIEHTWAYDMSGVHVFPGMKGELLTIEVIHGPDTGPKGESVCERTGGRWLIKFPHGTFGSAEQSVKRALLADRHSVWAFVFMCVAMQLLFEDLVDDVENKIKEIVHYLPKHASRIITHRASDRYLVTDREDLLYPDDDFYGVLKGVYRITLKNGTKIALDLAGAQYNLAHNTVMPWAEYLDRWAADTKYRLPFRTHYNKHSELMSKLHSPTHLGLVTEQMACFNTLLKNCEYELGFDLKDLPLENIDHFRKCMRRLAIAAEDSLLQRPRDLDAELAASSENVSRDAMTDELECIPGDIGDMKYFDWSKLSKTIAMPSSSNVTYKEKKRSKLLLKYRCAYKLPGDWRLVFMETSLPSVWVPKHCTSENPFFGKRK